MEPEKSAAISKPNGEQSTTETIANIRSVAGIVVAAFAGAINFVGLRSGELSTVLRNEASAPWILALIVIGILLAVGSVYVESTSKVSTSLFLLALPALMLPVAVTVALIRQPDSPVLYITWIAIGVGSLAAILLAGISIIQYRSGKGKENKGVPVQSAVIIAAIIFSASATFGSLRLETVCQSARSYGGSLVS